MTSVLPRSAPRRVGVAFLAVVAVAELLTACGPGRGSSSATSAAPVVVTQAGPRGQDVYLRSCARCHGDNQEGKNDSPALDSIRLTSLGDQRLRLTIQFGKGRMPGFGGLTTAQLEDLLVYLRDY